MCACACLCLCVREREKKSYAYFSLSLLFLSPCLCWLTDPVLPLLHLSVQRVVTNNLAFDSVARTQTHASTHRHRHVYTCTNRVTTAANCHFTHHKHLIISSFVRAGEYSRSQNAHSHKHVKSKGIHKIEIHTYTRDMHICANTYCGTHIITLFLSCTHSGVEQV